MYVLWAGLQMITSAWLPIHLKPNPGKSTAEAKRSLITVPKIGFQSGDSETKKFNDRKSQMRTDRPEEDSDAALYFPTARKDVL